MFTKAHHMVHSYPLQFSGSSELCCPLNKIYFPHILRPRL